MNIVSPLFANTSPTVSPVKYKANHPWMKIVSPGPWQHLPPVESPLPAPRTWYRYRVPPANPFDKTEASAEEAVGGSAQHVSDASGSDAAASAGTDVAPPENQSDSLPRSLSVPALASKAEAAPLQAKV